MIIVYQLSVFFILIISNPLKNDLSQFIIIKSVTLTLAVVSRLFLQTFGRFFLSRVILMSYFISYIFLLLMFLILLEGFCLIAQEGYQPLFLKDAG